MKPMSTCAALAVTIVYFLCGAVAGQNPSDAPQGQAHENVRIAFSH